MRDKERERDRERGWGEREQEKEGREEEKGREGKTWRKSVRERQRKTDAMDTENLRM